MIIMKVLQIAKRQRAVLVTQAITAVLIGLVLFTSAPVTKASACRPDSTMSLFPDILDAAYARFDDGGNFFVSFLLNPRHFISAYNGCSDSDGLVFNGGTNTIAPAAGTKLGTQFSPLQGTVTAGGLGFFQPLYTINFQEDMNRTTLYNPKRVQLSVSLDLNTYYDLVGGTLKTKPAYRNTIVNVSSATAVY